MKAVISDAGESPTPPPPPNLETPTPPSRPALEPESAAPSRPPGPGRPRWPWTRAARWALAGVGSLFALLVLSVAGAVAVLGWPSLASRTNVLIMGLDRTVSDQNPNIVFPVSRTDTLIAASFDPATHRVYLLSIPRDTLAAIPGHPTTKINAAHAWGGAPLTIRTVENFLGVRFPYYIEITARGYVHLIDAVGGVNVHIEKDLNYDDNWDGLHIHLKKGFRRLGGKAAIEFARFRHDPLGDLGRIQRQQDVMQALLDELRRPRIVTRIPRVLRVFREDIQTNLTHDQLIALALFGAGLHSGGLIRETLPGRLGEDWVPDIPRDREMVARIFYDVGADTLNRTTVEVVTDTAPRTAAAEVQARLSALGIKIVRIRTAATPGPTRVILHRGNARVAGLVAGLIGGIAVTGGPRVGGPDLTIFLASATSTAPQLGLPR